MAHRKNSELLSDPRASFMTGIEKQRLYLLRILSALKDCPNCAHRLNYFDAMFRGDVDALDLTKNCATDHAGVCPSCHRGLIYTLPFLGDWFFRLVPEVQPAHQCRAMFGGEVSRPALTCTLPLGHAGLHRANGGRV